MNRRTVLALVRMLPSVSVPLTIALTVAAIVQPALGLGFMLAVGRFVGQIPEAVRGDSGWTLTLAVVAGIYFAQQLLGAGAAIVEWRLGRRLNHRLDDRVMTAMLGPAGIAHLEDPNVRDLAADAADGLGAGRWRPAEVPQALRALVSGVGGVLVAFALAIGVQWWLGLLLLASTTWALHRVNRHVVAMLLEMIDAEGEAEFRRLEYERDAAVAPYSAKEVRLFGYAPWVLDRWQARLMRVLALQIRRMARFDLQVPLSVAAMTLAVGGGFAWAAIQVGRGELGLGMATVLAQALLAPLGHCLNIAQAHLDLAQTARPVTALRGVENGLSRISGAVTSGAATPSGRPIDAIRFENVSFRYPGTGTDVFRGLDLEFPAGSSLAIVGLNGAGKTTLVKLLCGFYDPTGGRITVDGIDIREFDRTAWQRQVAAIFQDFARYPMSARDNIRAGNLGAPQEALETVAIRAGAGDTIAGLPQGWDTVLSREFSGGADISGGQWQRVALSRALLAADQGAGVLVLDEPAANLDVRGEAELNASFLDLTRNRTTVVISHRLSTVRQAERICVIAHGRVVESGTHDELVATGGHYAELFRMQAARFIA